MPGRGEDVVVATSWRDALGVALRDGILRRALVVALVVGSLLSLINQGAAILGPEPIHWLKLALTYAVPFFVSTHGAVSASVGSLLRRATD